MIHCYKRKFIKLNLTGGSLFSGIGGFELGLLQSGLINEVKWQVEIDDFCNKVLEKHFPNTKRYGDIKDVGKHNLEPVDIIFGGFPCQPFSIAGKRKGKEDDRYLWNEMVRIIKELHPKWVIGENVPGIINMALDEVLFDLEGEGYETATFIIPACAVNAPHRRDRVWIIAYSNSNGWRKYQRISSKNSVDLGEYIKPTPKDFNSFKQRDVTNSKKFRKSYKCFNGINQQYKKSKGQFGRDWNRNWIEVATRLCRMDDVVPNRVDRLKCLGNAVVPQVVCAIGMIIKNWIYKNQNL